jgi:hypothetical protein
MKEIPPTSPLEFINFPKLRLSSENFLKSRGDPGGIFSGGTINSREN